MCNIQIVSIEGNIGSGKSTLLANLKTHFEGNANIIFLKEPVDEWATITDEHGTTILEKFYANQEKYAFSFQIMAYISRLNLLKEAVAKIKRDTERLPKDASLALEEVSSNKFIIVTERSLHTDRMVFAKMLYDSGKLESVNYAIYLKWFDAFAREFPVTKIVYVKATPETCLARIAARCREGEAGIPIEYLTLCDQYHDAMLDKTSDECVCTEQLVLNGNYNIYSNTHSHVLNEWITAICEFM